MNPDDLILEAVAIGDGVKAVTARAKARLAEIAVEAGQEPDGVQVIAALYWNSDPHLISMRQLAAAVGTKGHDFMALVRHFAPEIQCETCDVPFRKASCRSDFKDAQRMRAGGKPTSCYPERKRYCGPCLVEAEAEYRRRQEEERRAALERERARQEAVREAVWERCQGHCEVCWTTGDLAMFFRPDAPGWYFEEHVLVVLCAGCHGKLEERLEQPWPGRRSLPADAFAEPAAESPFE